jgi:amino acid transporter
MKNIIETAILVGVIQPDEIFTLRIFGIVALFCFIAIGVAIYRRRHQLFDRDTEVLNDTPAARHMRLEAVLIVWSAVMLALLGVVMTLW